MKLIPHNQRHFPNLHKAAQSEPELVWVLGSEWVSVLDWELV